MNLRRLPEALHGVCAGEAAIPRTLVARMVEQFHGREPRWRRLVSGRPVQRRLTSREWEVLELLAHERSTTAKPIARM
jgi:DNA-binding NarL/FixJ family response regulator